MPFTLECSGNSPRAPGGGFFPPRRLSFLKIALGPGSRLLRCPSLSGNTEFHSRAACLGKADCYCLFCGPGTMFPLADVVHFFAYKFASLCAGRLAFGSISPGALNGFWFWHGAPPFIEWMQTITAGWRDGGRMDARKRRFFPNPAAHNHLR